MNCPVCDAKLRAVEKHGVEVDICPDCKGVWLDRGELEKLLELASTDGPVQQRAPERPVERAQVRDDHDHHDSDRDRDRERERDHARGYDQHGSKPRKKGSWLTDILGAVGGGED